MEFAAFGFGETADHQGGGEGPGLIGAIGHCPRLQPHFLHQFAAHRFLDGLARFDEPGQRRKHPAGKLLAAPDQTMVAMRRQHDHHRIGAGEMLRLALAADTAIAAIGAGGFVAAAGAEAMAPMPVDQRLGLATDRNVLQRQKARRRAHIREMAKARQRSFVDRVGRGRNIQREQGVVFFEPQENARRIGRGQAFTQAGVQKARLQRRRGLFRAQDERHQPPHRQDIGGGIAELLRNPLRIAALVAGPVERISGEGDHAEPCLRRPPALHN